MAKIRFWKAVLLLMLLLGMIFANPMTVRAAPAVADTDSVDEFADLTGDAAYITKADNYSLDMEKTDWLETGYWILNSLANMLFTFIRWLAKVVVTLYYNCLAFDLAEMFHDEINEIQEALNTGIFEPLFLLAFCGSTLVLIKKMLRRDMMGAFGEILKVIGIVTLSVLVVKQSATVLSAATNVTKGVSTEALLGMQGEEVNSTTSYAAQSAGVLWVNLLHQPWVFIEFGDDLIDETDISSVLSNDVGSETRDNFVAEYVKGNAFSKDRAAEKIGFMFLYIFPFIIKSVVYIILAMLTLVFQLIAVFYVVIAPIVLILSMLPGFDGVISSWLQKLFESQVSILLMSFITGLLVKVDELLFDKCADRWGWLVVMVVQVVLSICVILYREKLFGALSNVQKAATRPGAAKNMIAGTDGMQIAKGTAKESLKAGKKTASLAERGIAATARETAFVGRAAGNYMKDLAGTMKSNVVIEAASNYQMIGGRARVERPVMTASMSEKKIAGGENMSVQSMPARSRSVRAQEGQTRIVRPRMDTSGIKNNVVKFESNRAASRPTVNGGDGGNVTRPVLGKPTQGAARTATSYVEKASAGEKENQKTKKTVQRPRASSIEKKTEGATSRQRNAAKMKK